MNVSLYFLAVIAFSAAVFGFFALLRERNRWRGLLRLVYLIATLVISAYYALYLRSGEPPEGWRELFRTAVVVIFIVWATRDALFAFILSRHNE